MSDPETIHAFDQDVTVHEGYVYTTGDRLASRLARARWVSAIRELTDMRGRRMLDLGCGDGHFSRIFYDGDGPTEIVGLDPSANAITSADTKKGERRITYQVGDGHSLPFADRSFDIVLIQGVLHHDNDAEGIVREACRVGREIIVFEPNGNSPLLKILEKVSPYHRQHKEKSYFPRTIDRWLTGAGATVVMRRYSNFVPVLAPELMARICKALEPAVEAIPVIRALGCAIYAVKAEVR